MSASGGKGKGSKGGRQQRGPAHTFDSGGTRVLDKGVWKRFKYCLHCNLIMVERAKWADCWCDWGDVILSSACGPSPLLLFSPPADMARPTTLPPQKNMPIGTSPTREEVKYCSDRCRSEAKRGARQQQQQQSSTDFGTRDGQSSL